MRSSATALILVAATLSGCGYSMGYHTVGDVRTVALDVVDNISFRQRVERDLTRAIQRSLSEYTGYRHTDHRRADAILKVELVALRNSTLVTNGATALSGDTAPVREGSLDAIARIRLIERHSGKVLVDTRSRDIAEYRVLIGETESSARRELVSDLGRLIVLALERDF